MLGRIGCDSNGKLNPKSAVLEGDRERSAGAQIPLELSELQEFSLFPGQVVVMGGGGGFGAEKGTFGVCPHPTPTPLSVVLSGGGGGGHQQHRAKVGGVKAL